MKPSLVLKAILKNEAKHAADLRALIKGNRPPGVAPILYEAKKQWGTWEAVLGAVHVAGDRGWEEALRLHPTRGMLDARDKS